MSNDYRTRVFAALDAADLTTADDLGDIPQAAPTPPTDPFASVLCPDCLTTPTRPVAGGWICRCGAVRLRQASAPLLLNNQDQ